MTVKVSMTVNGKPVSELRKLTLQPGDVVLFETPGGGGYGRRDG